MLSDICIGVLGLVSLTLFQRGRIKAASMVGLLAQPFWLYTAYLASQWGVLFICCLYTGVYIKGILSD